MKVKVTCVKLGLVLSFFSMSFLLVSSFRRRSTYLEAKCIFKATGDCLVSSKKVSICSVMLMAIEVLPSLIAIYQEWIC